MYSSKSGSISKKVVVFVQSACFREKVVDFRKKKDCIRLKWLHSGKNSCIRAKCFYSGKSGCIWSKVVVFGQKMLYSGKVVVLGQSG